MDNKEKVKYTDFLSNISFIKWRLYREEESDKYWSDFIEENPHCKEAIDIAIEKFKAVRLNKRHLSPEKTDELYEQILTTTFLQLKKRKRQRLYYLSAAVCIALFAVSVLFVEYTRKTTPEPVLDTIVGEALPSEGIQLVSGDAVIAIKQNADFQISAQGDISIWEEGEVKSSKADLEVETSKLVVPYGKRSTLLLADKTKIWINSGTEIEFPTNFAPSERRINIIKGEIYIEVAEDANKPFYVQTSEFDIRVYGTKFNVSCYMNSEKSVVLAEGKIAIQSNDNPNIILNRGELYSIDDSGKTIHQKVNVDEYTSWIDGVFIFKQITISDLLKKIGRYYNIEFQSNNLKLMHRTCTGKLYLSDDLEQVISVVCAISNTSYKKTGNMIYITDEAMKSQ